ncbi:unnamed protein product [Eruca vesicaria subsp. sativa]|uniref:Uncharacterized protein n=1 Tax=Eruca vesicaria subsp. sativa TaxID=29727 RepID=A0ABC8LR59_ERUVS|nr:unnamed protein product [Eruca vesicaria subsp. sativa]
MASSSSALRWVQLYLGRLSESYGASLLQAEGGYMSMDMFIKAYDREIKAGACLRITKCRGLEYCPTPMEHA